MDYSAAPDSKVELRELFVDAPGETSLHQNTTGVFLDKNEADLFDAVAKGELDLVKNLLNDTNNPLNINANKLWRRDRVANRCG